VELVVRDQSLFHYCRIVAGDSRVIDMAIERLVVGGDIALHDICAELPTTEVDRLARGRFEVRSRERRAEDGRAKRRGAEKASRASNERPPFHSQKFPSHVSRPP